MKVRNEQSKTVSTLELSEGLSIPGALLRRDLIKRAFDRLQSSARQLVEPKSTAGHRHSVKTRGKGTGSARVQRKKDNLQGAQSPNNVGGRRAHPPRSNAHPEKKINKNENRIAIQHCLCASFSDSECYSRSLNKESIIIQDTLEDKIVTTKDAKSFFDLLGFQEELEYVRARAKVRKPGQGKFRGRVHRHPRSFLLVVSSLESPIVSACRNIVGVDCVEYDRMNVQCLAPGGIPGRLLILTESAFTYLNEKY